MGGRENRILVMLLGAFRGIMGRRMLLRTQGVFNINHTFVDEKLRSQGIASKLVQMAVEEIQKRNGKVQATCSYAKKWLEKKGVEK